jgi:hypothetical protein
MATFHGNAGAVYISANAVAEVLSADYTESDVSIVDDSAIGDTEVSYLSGGRVDGSGSVTCHFDDTDTTGQEAMLTALRAGSTVTLNIYVEGVGSGDHERSGDVLIESYNLKLDQGSIVGATFNFKGVLDAGTQT